MKEYPFLWAGPVANIFNKIIQSSEWPTQWKIENAVPLHKTGDPRLVKDEDDVRTISKTKFLSKVLENILGDWLMPILEENVDPGQCGGMKNTSIQHYLVKMLDFIHRGVDKRTPHAIVIAALCERLLLKKHYCGQGNMLTKRNKALVNQVSSPMEGALLLNRAALPLMSATESFWNSLGTSTDSSSPVCRALAPASFLTSLTASGCHAPSDSTAIGKKTMPCLSQGSQDLSNLRLWAARIA